MEYSRVEAEGLFISIYIFYFISLFLSLHPFHHLQHLHILQDKEYFLLQQTRVFC